jgi:hypothetical protein
MKIQHFIGSFVLSLIVVMLFMIVGPVVLGSELVDDIFSGYIGIIVIVLMILFHPISKKYIN